MTTRRFRIKTPTIAILSSGGQRVRVTVPAGVIVVAKSPPENNLMIDVVWNGTDYLMFAQDLRDRSEPVD